MLSSFTVANTPVDSGVGVVIAYLIYSIVALLIIGPLAFFIGRDANRRGLRGWLWGVLFILQPMIVGLTYVVVRAGIRSPQTRHPATD